MEKPTINGVILVLTCQKYKETRLKEFKFLKNEYCSGKWKVIYVLGDLFLDKEFTLNGNIMTIRCEDSYIHLLKKLALAVKYVYQIFDIKEGILRCSDDVVVNESRLELFLRSVKYDFYGQSDMRRDIHIPYIDILKETTYDKLMINYYSKHPEDFENPLYNLKGVKIEDYALRPKVIGPYGVLFYISNWACRILVEEMESIDFNIFHKDDFTNSYPYTIEDCGVTYIMYKHGIPLRDEQIFFDRPNSIATYTNKYKFDHNINKKNEKLENNNNENEYSQLSTKYPTTINMYATPLNPSKQKIHFITYGNNRFSKVKDMLAQKVQESGWFDSVTAFNENMLTSEFKTKFANILNQPRGGGYWIWKYDIIMQTLNKINDGDIIVYVDGGSYLNLNGKKRFLEYIDMLNSDEKQLGLISFDNGCCEERYTVRQVFDHFDIQEDSEIRTSGQLNGGYYYIKKTPHLLMLFEKYRETLEQNPLIYTDYYNKIDQKENFIDNRHDQSVFSVIRKKYGTLKLIENGEFWWADNDFECEEAQTKPFWATRLKDMCVVTIGSEGKGSWGKRIINGLIGPIAPKFPWFKKPSFLYANTQECNFVVKSHFNNEEPPWNRSMKPYLLWSGESYTVPVPPNASKYLHIASTFIDDPNSIYVPYVLDSPYLYQERCLNGDRQYLLAYCSSNPVILREILFNKFVEKAGKDQCHALGKCFGGMYPETHRKLEGTWESEQLIDEYKKYKFVFAIENKKVPGYVTEKIMNAFHAGAIPIYWGSDNIGELFNSDAFINVSDFDSFDACVNHVTSMSEEKIEKMREQEIYNKNSDIIHLLDHKYKNNKVLHEYLQKIIRTIS